MAFRVVEVVKRGIGDALGLPTPTALVIFIGVPVLVLGSTGILLYYCLKARSAKRKARAGTTGRPPSKSSHHTLETDQEMGLASIQSPTYASSTVGSHRHSLSSHHFQTAGPNEFDRKRFAAPVYGSRHPQAAENSTKELAEFFRSTGPPGSGPYRAPPSYGNEVGPPKFARKGMTPSPITIPPQRPKTAPSSPLNGVFNGPINVNLRNYGNPAPLQQVRPVTANDADTSPRRTLHRRSKSLEKPPPIKISSKRPTHSPAGSVRSLSVFPHRHVNPSSPSFSPTTQGFPSSSPPPNGASPSPPVSPMSGYYAASRRTAPSQIPPPPPPPTARWVNNTHVRHPSVDRNSMMPIAPILIPFDTAPSTPTILSDQQQRSGSRQGRKRGNSHTGNYL